MNKYSRLLRLDKPIGFLLLLWPTLWGLWLASHGRPSPSLLIIFSMGVLVMRSAGCIINDIADRHIDGFVKRTQLRPLATGEVNVLTAFIVFSCLCCCALGLVLLLNTLCLYLAIIGLLLAIVYPFLKRVIHCPQLGLGLAFSWGIPMAFAAQTNTVPSSAWVLFAAAAIWSVIYDTMYAIADKEDDLVVGVRSTAILFGRADKQILLLLKVVFLSLMVWVGILFKLANFYFIGLFITALLFAYQQSLLQTKHPFQAFLNNNWVGVSLFAGIAMSYVL